jgi:hypothetical protein
MTALVSVGFEDYVESAFDSGWTDGLPVLPPEVADVSAALATVRRDAGTVLWSDEGRSVSIGDVAIATIVAGCSPSWLPVVLAASEAVVESLGDDGLTVPTIADASQVVVANGPVRNRLNINCGFGLYGPGWRANATIGRALRFVVRAILSPVVPAFGDPGQYTLCFGEDEENSQWTPLHAQRGCDAGSSAVTVLSTVVRSLCHDRHSSTPEALLDNLAVYGRGRMSGAGWFGDEPCSLLLVFPPESKRVLGTWTKELVHEHLYDRLVADDGAPIQPVRLQSPDDLLLVAAGGPAFAAVQLLLAHRVQAVTKQLREEMEPTQ